MTTSSKTSTARVDLYQAVTDAIIAELEQGLEPWKRPWKTTGARFPLRHNGQPCKTACKSFQILECAPAGGQNGRFELTPLAGLPEDGSHDEVSVAQRGVQTAGC